MFKIYLLVNFRHKNEVMKMPKVIKLIILPLTTEDGDKKIVKISFLSVWSDFKFKISLLK